MIDSESFIDNAMREKVLKSYINRTKVSRCRLAYDLLSYHWLEQNNEQISSMKQFLQWKTIVMMLVLGLKRTSFTLFGFAAWQFSYAEIDDHKTAKIGIV